MGFHGYLIHGDGSFRHRVQSAAGWQERQLHETHAHGDFGDGILDLAFELFEGLGAMWVTNRNALP